MTSSRSMFNRTCSQSAPLAQAGRGESAAVVEARPRSPVKQQGAAGEPTMYEDDSSSRSQRQDGKQSTSMWATMRDRCAETISHDEATIPLAWQALLTGLVDGLIYGRSMIWTGFQTGEEAGWHTGLSLRTSEHSFALDGRQHGSILAKCCSVHPSPRRA